MTEDFFGGGFGNPACQRAGAKLFPETPDQIVRPAAAHCTSQRLGLAGREPGERLAHLQHLILIENDAEGFGETVAEQGMVDRRLVRLSGGVRAALLLAATHVWIYRTTDDRSRPHD